MPIEWSQLRKLNFVNEFRSLRQGWPNRSPKQKWQFLCDIPDVLMKIFGIRVLGDCRIYWLSMFPSFLVFDYFGLSIYTLIYYGTRGRFFFGTRCLCGVGIVSTSCTLYVKCLTSDRYRLKKLFRFSGDHIYKDVKDGTPLHRLCEESVEKMRKSYIILVLVIFVTIGSVITGPIEAYLHRGIKVTPFGTKTPFFEEDSDIGFTVDMVFQSCMMPFGIISTICIELCQCLTYNTVELCADIVTLNTEQISNDLESGKRFDIQLRAQFRNALIQIQDFDRYLMEFADVFYWKTFLGPPLLTFGATYGIFSQWIVRRAQSATYAIKANSQSPTHPSFVVSFEMSAKPATDVYQNDKPYGSMDFPAGYGNAIVSYIALLVLCYMGQNIDSANETICDALTDMKWYCLPLSKQKDVAHILNRMQNGVIITQGPLNALNYDMASTLTNRIYSTIMLLGSFVK